ncbi:MAG: alpha amylase family protein [Muribaculaceae bacterium]|nr:alpha amylase family protein [Muribaculaceae bacterium]
MKINKIFLAALFVLMSLCACGGDSEPTPTPEPEPTPDTEESKPVMVWVDASANFTKFIEKSGVTAYLEKAKNAGFTDIILDVRPTSGEVMYKGSQYAPEIVTWKGVTRDNSWDYLEFFVTESHRLGLKIHAAMNSLTAGQNIMRRGPVYTDPAIAAMTSKLYTEIGLIDEKDDGRGAVFLNPCLPEAQEYVLNIAKEIVTKYDIDGLIYDRCRYDNEDADWTDASKTAFAAYVKAQYGREGLNLPKDVYSYDNLGKRVYGAYRQIWYEWRASVIHDFFYKTKAAVKAIKPNIKFSTYTGGWYSTYYQEGSNWASNTYDPSTEFSEWANSKYKNTGFAEALDMHLAGFYYAAIEGSGWWTIAGGITNVKRVNNGACDVISSLAPEKFVGNAAGLKSAINVSMRNADGMMIFDLYHIEENNFWNTIKEGLESVNQ